VELYPAGNKLIPPQSPINKPTRIFVKTDFLEQSLQYLRNIKSPFHLLTGSSDIPGCPDREFASMIRAETRIQSWVGTNLVEHFPWMFCVPIGLEEQGRFGREPESLSVLYRSSGEKEIDIYVPFFSDTNPLRREFISALKSQGHKRYTFENQKLSFEDYVARLQSSMFTLCLPGNGHDTLRIYEAVLSHSMPIVLSTPIWRMHSRLGYLIVTSPDEVSKVTNFPNAILPSTVDITVGIIRNQILGHQLRSYRQ
jgi:hypothetical protein